MSGIADYKITNAEVTANDVASVTLRPTDPIASGGSGMSGTQLKAKKDALAKLIRTRHDSLIDALVGLEVENVGVAGDITGHVEGNTIVEDINAIEARVTTAESDIETLQTDLNTAESGITTLETNLGDLTSLTTTVKTSAVAAINEVKATAGNAVSSAAASAADAESAAEDAAEAIGIAEAATETANAAAASADEAAAAANEAAADATEVAEGLETRISGLEEKSVNAYRFTSSVATYAALPTDLTNTNDDKGKVYNIIAETTTPVKLPAGANVAWNGTGWDSLGGSFKLSQLGLLLSPSPITINFTTKNIVISATSFLNDGTGNYTISAATINFSNKSDNVMCVWYDKSTLSHIVTAYDITPTQNYILWAIMRVASKTFIVNGNTQIHVLDSASPTVGQGLAYVLATNPIVISLTNSTLTLAGTTYLFNGTTYKTISAGAIDFSAKAAQNTIQFCYNTSTSVVEVYGYGDILPKENIVWAILRISGKQFTINSADYAIEEDGDGFVWATNKYAIPKELYLLSNVDYSIMAQNACINKAIDIDKVLFELALPNKVAQSKNALSFSIPFECAFFTKFIGRYKFSTTAFSKDIKVNVKDAQVIAQQSPKILMIGDSTTHSNIPGYLNWWLEKYGLTPEFIGTVTAYRDDLGYNLDVIPTGLLSEGRRGWRLVDFTGDAVLSNKTPYIDARNPFINEDDEFDFEYYMTENEFTSVNYVIIQLGTNDILEYSDSELEYSVSLYKETLTEQLSGLPTRIQKIITSIHAYDSNIKIGLNPPTPAGTNKDFNISAALYAENIIHNFSDTTNVYVLPAYLSNGIISTPAWGDITLTDVSAENNTKSSALSKNVHPNGIGQLINALWSASWILNFAT